MAYYSDPPYDPLTGKSRMRRPVTDYGSTYVRWMRHRSRPGTRQKMEQERPSASYIVDMLPPAARLDSPADSLPSKHLHSSLNKIKHPIFVVKWTPEGRRLLTGSSSGEFTLWNGMGFNFETIMQAHDSAIRAASWSHNDDWLLSADNDGILKYWQPNFNNVKAIQAHENAPIRDLAFSPTDSKFVTASDDATLKVWDFAGGVEESTITGHGWDVKAVDWHPSKGLLVSGSKDHQVKLWDPRTGRCLTTLHGHKNGIAKTLFEPNRGDLLATCARDPTARIFDLRMMRDVILLRGHDRDIMTLCWHPIHSSLLSTGAVDGSLFHYLLDEPNTPEGTTTNTVLSPYDSPDPANAPAQTIYPAHKVSHAHEFAIWSLDWHPVGHILASGSNDRITRFWARARPGETDCFSDRYHLGDAAAEPAHGWNRHRGARNQTREEEEQQELDDEAEGLVDQGVSARPPLLPGLPGIGSAAPVPPPLRDGTSAGGSQPFPLSQYQLPGMAAALSQLPGMPFLPPQQQQHHQALVAGGYPPPPPPPLIPSASNGAGATGQMPDLSRSAGLFGGAFAPPPPQLGSRGLEALNGSLLQAGNAQGNQQQQQQPPPPPPPHPPLPGFGSAFPGLQGLPPGFPPLDSGASDGAKGGGYAAAANEHGASANANDTNGSGGGDPRERGAGGGRRKRAPLPSQQDIMREEMRKGGHRR